MYIGKHRKVYIGGSAPRDILPHINLGQDLSLELASLEQALKLPSWVKKSRGLIKAP
jgi:hypothetical protein